MYQEDKDNASIKISGGTFSSDVSDFLKSGFKINNTDEGYVVVAE
jgi:hypothetical protein